MSVGDFGRYITAELKAIARFRKAESKRQGRQLSNNEAAAIWAATQAAGFRAGYEAGERGTEDG